MAVKLGRAVPLREGADANSPIMAELANAEDFEVFELAGNNAWGIACASGLVGYIQASAIAGTAK